MALQKEKKKRKTKKESPSKTKDKEGMSPAVNNNFEMSTTIVVIRG